MLILGKSDLYHQTTFKDLKQGDIFYFLKNCTKADELKIYMRCGTSLNNKTSAIDLNTGCIYPFDENEPVEVVDAILSVKRKDNEEKI